MAAATAGVNLDQALSDRRELNTIKRGIGAHENASARTIG
jgi:hypothetical protein